MKVVVQRVERASVEVDGEIVGQVGTGMLLLLGVMEGDDEICAAKLADKLSTFRFFSDDAGKMNRSALDVAADGAPCGVLVVSQFTLAADGKRGRRPSFDRAARPEAAEPLYEFFCDRLRAAGLAVATGRFGAMMRVELVNDGPVTFVLEHEPEPVR